MQDHNNEYYEEPTMKIFNFQAEDVVDLSDLENPENGGGWA